MKKLTHRYLTHVCLVAGITCAAVAWASAAAAGEPADRTFLFDSEAYLLDVRRYELDETSRVIGWELKDNIYFGRQQGDNDAFGFLWQRPGSQISLTNKGLGWRKRLSH